MYDTAEGRKQRNRQAQAEFRKRREDYIKQLEISIKENERKVEEMQENHNSISKECQGLRHQNQLLERLRADKGGHDYSICNALADLISGVNVQSELQAGGAIHWGKSSKSNTESQDSAQMVQKAPDNQHESQRKPPSSLAPRFETHLSMYQPLRSPEIGAKSVPTTHAMCLGPQWHESFHDRGHVAGQQYSQALFSYRQMPRIQHQPMALMPDVISPNIDNSSWSYDQLQ